MKRPRVTGITRGRGERNTRFASLPPRTVADRSPSLESEVIGMTKKSSGKSHRSAVTGRYVKASTAKRHPNTTVSEKRKK